MLPPAKASAPLCLLIGRDVSRPFSQKHSPGGEHVEVNTSSTRDQQELLRWRKLQGQNPAEERSSRDAACGHTGVSRHQSRLSAGYDIGTLTPLLCRLVRIYIGAAAVGFSGWTVAVNRSASTMKTAPSARVSSSPTSSTGSLRTGRDECRLSLQYEKSATSRRPLAPPKVTTGPIRSIFSFVKWTSSHS